MSIVLFGVGSSLVVEYEETCRRLELTVVAGVRNRAGASFLSASNVLREVDEVDGALLRIPCLCPLFTPANRRTACAEAEGLGFVFASALVDRHAIVAASTEIGAGSYVNSGAVIGAAGRIGRHAVINRLAGIGHHARVGDFVSIGPGVTICGEVVIAENVLVGARAVVLPKVTIGAGAVVRAGTVVKDDVPPGAMV